MTEKQSSILDNLLAGHRSHRVTEKVVTFFVNNFPVYRNYKPGKIILKAIRDWMNGLSFNSVFPPLKKGRSAYAVFTESICSKGITSFQVWGLRDNYKIFYMFAENFDEAKKIAEGWATETDLEDFILKFSARLKRWGREANRNSEVPKMGSLVRYGYFGKFTSKITEFSFRGIFFSDRLVKLKKKDCPWYADEEDEKEEEVKTTRRNTRLTAITDKVKDLKGLDFIRWIDVHWNTRPQDQGFEQCNRCGDYYRLGKRKGHPCDSRERQTGLLTVSDFESLTKREKK